MKERIQEAWLEHLGIDKRFPRDVAYPWRVQVTNKDEYLRRIESMVRYSNIYTSLYPYNGGVVDKIYLDVDAPTIEEAKKALDMVVQRSRERWDYTPRVYYTGGRGFAVYWDFEPAKVDLMGAREALLSLFYSPYVDTHVLGDERRVSRVPYTLNYNNLLRGDTPRLCVPINPDWSVHEILEESKKCKFRKEIEIVPCEAFRKEAVTWKYVPKVYPAKSLEINNSEVLNYLVSLSEKITDGRHRIIHYLIVPTLVAMGYTDEQILAFCRAFIEKTGKSWVRYERYVERSIRRTREGNWRPWTPEKFLLENPDLWEVLAWE
jgi:hypothetical protein